MKDGNTEDQNVLSRLLTAGWWDDLLEDVTKKSTLHSELGRSNNLQIVPVLRGKEFSSIICTVKSKTNIPQVLRDFSSYRHMNSAETSISIQE